MSFSATAVRQYFEPRTLAEKNRMKSAEPNDEPPLPKIVSRGEWQWACDLLRIKKKATIRAREALSAEQCQFLPAITPPLSSSC
jgi:hypothetical protein